MRQRRSSTPIVDFAFLALRAWRQRALGDVWHVMRDRSRFLRMGGQIAELYPIFGERDLPAGSARGHYFHQDLLVARLVAEASPSRHLDVGSRVDGFVAHVASFRRIEVVDIRPMPPSPHPNITCVQADLMSLDASFESCTDSLSCLHVLEHLGLGRYGDPIDPHGHLKGLDTLSRMVQSGGRLYVSSPIGHPKVCFNAHRVLDPQEYPRALTGRMKLERFDFVDDGGELHMQRRPDEVPSLVYGCGIYTFRRAR